MKKMILVLIAIFFMGCVSYNPDYMESKTTEERIIDIAIVLGYGMIIGYSINYYIEE